MGSRSLADLGTKSRYVAVVGVACLLLAVAAAVAASAEQRSLRTQLLRHPNFATQFALPLVRGRLLLGGTLKDGRTALVVLRWDGSLDPSFADHGVARFGPDMGPAFDGEELGSPVAVDRKGRILFVVPGTSLRRLLPDGRPDRSFGSAGTVRIHFAKPDAYVTSVAVQPGGKILVGGSNADCYKCGDSPALTRLTGQGKPDPSFGRDGNVVLAGRYDAEEPRVLAITFGPRHEIFAVSGGGPGGPTIQRLSPKGRMDHSFGRGGSLVVGEGERSLSGIFALPKIAVTAGGELVVASSVGRPGGKEAMTAYRYLPTGRPDPSFGRHGRAGIAATVSAFTGAVGVRSNGSIVLAGTGLGNHSRYFLLGGMRPDGRPDPTVGPGGFAKVRVGSSSFVEALVLRAKTAIEIGYTTHSGVSQTLLSRLPLSP
jgi:uncharacterized delta-60 repeat protein